MIGKLCRSIAAGALALLTALAPVAPVYGQAQNQVSGALVPQTSSQNQPPNSAPAQAPTSPARYRQSRTRPSPFPRDMISHIRNPFFRISSAPILQSR